MAEKKGNLLNTNERDGVQYKKAAIWELILGMANRGNGVIFYMMMGYASFIGPLGYAIPALVIGTVIMVMRIFDGITDAWVATIFEKMPPKLPKVRIFLLVGWVMESLGVLLMYKWAAGKFEGVTAFVIFIVIYVFYIVGYTINNIAGGTVGIMITNDPTQRPMMGLVGTLYSYSVPLLLGNILNFYILPKHDNQFNLACFGDIAVYYVLLSLIFVVIACIGVCRVDVPSTYERIGEKEKKTADGKKKKAGVSFKDIVAVLKDNKETQMYMWSCISDKFAQTIMSQGVLATLLTGVLIGSYKAGQVAGNFSTLISFGFTFIGGIFIAKYGAKKSTVVWSWISIILAASQATLCLVLGPKGMSKIGTEFVFLAIWVVFTVVNSAVKMILTTTATSMRADVVDYELYRSGNYFPAVLSGVYNFVDKIIGSVASVIAGACMTVLGYVNTVPQMGDKPTWQILIVVILVMYLLPIIGWSINLIAMKFYSLDREKMVEVQKVIAEKKAAAKAANAK